MIENDWKILMNDFNTMKSVKKVKKLLVNIKKMKENDVK